MMIRLTIAKADAESSKRRLFARYHAKPDILRRRRPLAALAGGDVGTAAEGSAFAVIVGPFGDVAAEVEDRGLGVGAMEATDFFQQRRTAAKALDRRLQFQAVLGIDGVAGPVIERVLPQKPIADARQSPIIIKPKQIRGYEI
jgi:hypothetical protein